MLIGSKKHVCCPLQPHLGQDTQPAPVQLQFQEIKLNCPARDPEEQPSAAPPHTPCSLRWRLPSRPRWSPGQAQHRRTLFSFAMRCEGSPHPPELGQGRSMAEKLHPASQISRSPDLEQGPQSSVVLHFTDRSSSVRVSPGTDLSARLVLLLFPVTAPNLLNEKSHLPSHPEPWHRHLGPGAVTGRLTKSPGTEKGTRCPGLLSLTSSHFQYQNLALCKPHLAQPWAAERALPGEFSRPTTPAFPVLFPRGLRGA